MARRRVENLPLPGAFAPYLLALLLLGLAVAVTDLLWPHNERSPFALFYLAIIVATGFGSTGAGVLTLLGSIALVNYLFLPPYHSFSLQAGLLDTALYASVGALIVPIIHRLRRERINLRTSQEHLQAVVEHLTEGLIISDLSGRLLLSNRASIKMHGFSDLEEWHQRVDEFADIFELFNEDGSSLDLPSWPLARIIKGEPLRDCEVRVRRRDRDWERTFRYSGDIVQSAEGESLAFITITDVTERDRAELTATRLAAIVASSNDAIIGKTLEGRITSWNSGATTLYGYTAEEAVDRSINFLVPPAGMDDERLLIERIRRGERLNHFETVRLKKDGSSVNVSMTVSPVRDHSGKVVAISAISRDITEQKQANAALRASELRYQRVVLNVPGMVYEVVRHGDGSFSFPFVSEGCREILGVEPEQIQNDPDLAMRAFHPEDRVSYEESVAESAATLHPWKWEGRFVLSSGEVKWVQGAARPERQENGDTLWEGVLMDITERKRSDEFQRAKEEAERANVAKSEFLSRMSHELRTPLNAILGFGQLLEMTLADHRESKSVDHILKAGHHLLKLINEVLDLARIESGRIELSPEPVPIHNLVLESLTMIRPLAAERQIEITIIGDATPPSGLWASHVRADRQRLRQVLLNLFSNAVKYNATGGKVSVECVPGSSSEQLRLRVADTGRGIALTQRVWLFKPFERLGAEFNGVEGTGLGLALAKRLMELMGGGIGLEDDPPKGEEQGSVFWIEVPLTVNPLEMPPATGDTARGDHPEQRPLPSGSCILYLEDNLPNQQLIERLLNDSPGVELLSAMQGRMGLDLARQHRPDLILLDVHLPDMPGWEVLMCLRSDKETADIPVVVISADATERQIQRMMDLGAFAYLAKPINVREFLRTVSEALSIKH